MITISEGTLATLLQLAAEAHHNYEIDLGKKDADWAQWYAQWIFKQIPHTDVMEKTIHRLVGAADSVIENWEKGDLASAVNNLEAESDEAKWKLSQLTPSPSEK